jgi:hypothetical protein
MPPWGERKGQREGGRERKTERGRAKEEKGRGGGGGKRERQRERGRVMSCKMIFFDTTGRTFCVGARIRETKTERHRQSALGSSIHEKEALLLPQLHPYMHIYIHTIGTYTWANSSIYMGKLKCIHG